MGTVPHEYMHTRIYLPLYRSHRAQCGSWQRVDGVQGQRSVLFLAPPAV